MSKTRMPLGISFFLVFFLALEIYYFFFDIFTSEGIFAQNGYPLASLSTPLLAFTMIILIITAAALIIITYGFLKRRASIRIYTMFYLVWAACWPIWDIYINNNVIGHGLLIIIYMLLIVYLTTAYVKNYFADIFRYGEYTLHKRAVTLKSGMTLTIYFFSKKIPKSGTPTSLPDGYTVGVSEQSKMPYLKKQDTKKIFSPKKIYITPKEIKSKKLANVTYVVRNQQPGQIRSDWAVRSHEKIYSHHRTKIIAINKARKIARSKDSTVMVQNTDGTFSIGFKPKPAKR
jgi:hypothetical protein